MWGAVGMVFPAVEVCALRWSGEAQEQASSLHNIVDGGGNESCLIGDAFEAAAFPDLDEVRVRITVNGAEATIGSGANVLGHPKNSLAWLANHLNDYSVSTETSQYGGGSVIGLRQGDFIMSGAAAVLPADSLRGGDTVVAQFEGMGEVTVQITGDSAISATTAAEAAAAVEAAKSTAAAARLDSTTWRELCAAARSLGLRVPAVYPWTPEREEKLRAQIRAAPSTVVSKAGTTSSSTGGSNGDGKRIDSLAALAREIGDVDVAELLNLTVQELSELVTEVEEQDGLKVGVLGRRRIMAEATTKSKL